MLFVLISQVDDKYTRNSKSKLDWSELHMLDVEGNEDIPQENVKLEQKYSSSTVSTMGMLDERQIPFELIVRLLETICFEDETYIAFSAAILVFLPGLGEIRRLNDMLGDHPFFGSDAFRIYALHSTISNENQSAAFDIPPPGVRKIVIGRLLYLTVFACSDRIFSHEYCGNRYELIHQTVLIWTNLHLLLGITIPDITCVIDSGKHREMRYVITSLTGIMLIVFLFISSGLMRSDS